MTPLWCAALLATAAPGGPSFAALFSAGELVALERARWGWAERGQDPSVGEVALFDDLSRLVRCLPLGPIPDHEVPEVRALRLLVRVERVRLEIVARDGGLAEAAVAQLVRAEPLYPAVVRDRGVESFVRWPVEPELWPEERGEQDLEPSRCAERPGVRREPTAAALDRGSKARARALRVYVAQAVEVIEALPPPVGAKIALQYLADVSRAGAVELPERWRRTLERVLAGGEAPYRSAGLLALAREEERLGGTVAAIRLLTAVTQDPGATPDEDSRARARLAGLLEPDYSAIVEAVRGVRAPRPEDAAYLANAEARALYALGRFDELESFGRVWLRRSATSARPGEATGEATGEAEGPPAQDPLDVMTRELLLRVSLEREPGRAIAWALELGPDDPRSNAARLHELAQLAFQSGHLELAAQVYDRLRLDAAAARRRGGPSAASEEARWLAERAAIEWARGDPERFGGLLEELVALARAEQERPLARYAPHRELARLTQELLPRMGGADPPPAEVQPFAAHLLTAGVALSAQAGRWRGLLLELGAPLRSLAGPYADLAPDAGAPRVGADEGMGARPREARAPRRVRRLGEVVLPRLPPRLEHPDLPTALPFVPSFLAYPDAAGRLTTEVPWASRVPPPGR